MEYKVNDTSLTSVANSIRAKSGTSADLSFPDGFVTAINGIPSGGATLISKLITANGTYDAEDDNADGYSSVEVIVPSSGTDIIKGTFTGTSVGAMSISIPYSGNGYAIAGIFYPSAGSWTSTNGLPALVQKNAVLMWAFVKNDVSTSPNYTSNVNESKAESFYFYKTSDSDATATGGGRTHQNRIYNSGANAGAYSDSMVRIQSKTSMQVYINNSGTGFVKDVEYTYVLIYSS